MATGDTERSQRWHIEYVGGPGRLRWTAYHTVAECAQGAALCRRAQVASSSFVELTNWLADLIDPATAGLDSNPG